MRSQRPVGTKGEAQVVALESPVLEIEVRWLAKVETLWLVLPIARWPCGAAGGKCDSPMERLMHLLMENAIATDSTIYTYQKRGKGNPRWSVKWGKATKMTKRYHIPLKTLYSRGFRIYYNFCIRWLWCSQWWCSRWRDMRSQRPVGTKGEALAGGP